MIRFLLPLSLFFFFVAVVEASRKSCPYHDEGGIHQCYVDCFDCIDQPICTQVLSDLQLIDPNLVLNATISNTIASLTKICNDDLNDNAANTVDCGYHTCGIDCRICHGLDTCNALQSVTTNATYGDVYILKVVNQYIHTACTGVVSNASEPSFSTVRLICMCVWCLVLLYFRQLSLLSPPPPPPLVIEYQSTMCRKKGE